jgi:hypothetical protein
MNTPFDIDNYHKEFSKYPKCLMESEGRVYGFFFIGNQYKRVAGYYGEYPPSYLKRIRALFPGRKPVLHLFGGTVAPLTDEFTLDVNPNLKPSICGNAQQVGQLFQPKSFELVVADPPYSRADAIKYGYKMPNARLTLRSAREIIKDDGILVWLDVRVPIFRKLDWKLIGTIGLFTGTNRVIRVISLFQAN